MDNEYLTFPLCQPCEIAEDQAESYLIGTVALMQIVWPELQDSMHPLGALAVWLQNDLFDGRFDEHFRVQICESEIRLHPKTSQGRWFLCQHSALEEHAANSYRRSLHDLFGDLARIGSGWRA